MIADDRPRSSTIDVAMPVAVGVFFGLWVAVAVVAAAGVLVWCSGCSGGDGCACGHQAGCCCHGCGFAVLPPWWPKFINQICKSIMKLKIKIETEFGNRKLLSKWEVEALTF